MTNLVLYNFSKKYQYTKGYAIATPPTSSPQKAKTPSFWKVLMLGSALRSRT